MIEEEFSNEKKIELIEKYGPLILCSIDDRFWAVNGETLVKIKDEKIELLEYKIKKLKNIITWLDLDRTQLNSYQKWLLELADKIKI